MLYLSQVYYQNVHHEQNESQTMKYEMFYFDNSYTSKAKSSKRY